MSSEYIVPMCPQCGSPLPNLPTAENAVTCEFCNGKVYGREKTAQSQQLKEDYASIYSEVMLVKQEFPKVEIIGADIAKIRVPVTSQGSEYDVLVVLDEFPKDIFVDYPRGLRSLIGPPNYLTTVTSWAPGSSHAVDVLREIKSMANRSRAALGVTYEGGPEDISALSRSFQVEQVSPSETRIYIYTPRTRFFTSLNTATSPPQVTIPSNIKRVLPIAGILEQRYNAGEITIGDLVGRLEYAANVQDRIITEIQKLRNNFVNVTYQPETRQISLIVPVEPIRLQFQITLPDKFPIVRPVITLQTRLKNRQLEDAILKRMNFAMSSWTRFNSILDILTEIQGVVATFLYGRY
ncbi:MAG: hypothetical protein ACTSW4_07265 [Candidatus Ranarchaeia archaeon]